MASGNLYLVPNLLGIVPPEAVLPAHTIGVARGLRHFVAENAKAARAFLKTIGTSTAIQSISIEELNERSVAAQVESLLAPALAGYDLGLLSDAGCPAVADPGAKLVAAAHQSGIRVVPLVGPSSILLALMASGMNGQGFAFHGYLPAKSEPRIAALRRLDAAFYRNAVPQRRDGAERAVDLLAGRAIGSGRRSDARYRADCRAARGAMAPARYCAFAEPPGNFFARNAREKLVSRRTSQAAAI